jgi:hypothetical protein
MKILGVGLSRTGTLSLCEALKILGFNSIHWEPERLRDIIMGENNNPSFRRYDDVDAVTDLPASIFYKEIKKAYPECKFILTIRDENSWYRSIEYHYNICVPINMKNDPTSLTEAKKTQNYIYGSSDPTEFLYKKKFREHNESIIKQYPNTLVMNIENDANWETLCGYLKMPIPNIPFPHKNKRSYETTG